MAKKRAKRKRRRDMTMIEKCEGDEEIYEIAMHYLQHHPKWRGPKEGELAAIDEALENYTVEECKLAIDGLHLSDYHNGNDPRNESGTVYLRIGLAFRETTVDGHIERAMKLLRKKEGSRLAAAEGLKKEQEKKKDMQDMLARRSSGISYGDELRKAIRGGKSK